MSKIRLDTVENSTILSATAIDDKHDMHDLSVLLMVVLSHSMILFYFDICFAYDIVVCTPAQTDVLSVFLTVVLSHSMISFNFKIFYACNVV
jgi:hypothetical protein